MKTILLAAMLGIMTNNMLHAKDSQLEPYAGSPGWAESKQQRIKWFEDAKFGMFIHFGLYSTAGGYWPPNPATGKMYRQPYAEWIRTWANVSEPEYGNLTKPLFKPDRGCTDEWAELAKRAGMKYAVLTTKHHEGYTLFNSDAPYSVSNKVTGTTNISPPGRDMVQEYADSMRKQGIRVGYYYSLLDWQHPDAFPISRKWPLAKHPDHKRYTQYMHNHILQLFTEYGKSDILWVDYSSGRYQGKTWETRSLLDKLHKIQPGLIINNRFWNGLENDKGDFFTPEKYIPPTGYPGRCFEVCHTMNESFGFSYHDKHWKSTKDVVHLLVDIVSKGGNLLLNVGPDAHGHVPEESVKVLLETGKWLNEYGDSIYKTKAGPFPRLPFDGRCTQKPAPGGKTILYLHLFQWPQSQKIQLPGLKNKVVEAKLMGGNDVLEVTPDPDGDFISLPQSAPDKICSVIQVTINGKPDIGRNMATRQKSDRSFTLKADKAILSGPTIRTVTENGITHIGWWLNTKSKVELPFIINNPGKVQPGGTVSKEPGRYEVYADCAVDVNGGGRLKLTIPNNNQTLETVIKPGSGWSKYEIRKLGEISLSKAGWDKIILEATAINPAGFMNIRSIKLKPIE